jgi:phosphoribosylformimino-5-aminoimidazole carboxamide ribotide isomerase
VLRAGLMELYPAIDLRDGGAVRLLQGDYDRQSDFGDPFVIAERYAAGGAPWLHLVDLDAARTGEPVNRPLVRELLAVARVPVQVSGGVRTEDDIVELLGAGARRVVLGTAALDDPGECLRLAKRYPGRLSLGLDYRRRPDGTLEAASRGWVEASGRSVDDMLDALGAAPLGAVVVTAIERDGTLGGPDLEGLTTVLEATEIPVVASGGVGSVEDLAMLAGLRAGGRRLSGSIVGRAILEGRIQIAEGVAACAAFA